MTIAENIGDAISFASSLGDVCLVVAIVGCIFMLVASACVLGRDLGPYAKRFDPLRFTAGRGLA